ncbi:choice-of-anchor B family protein [Aureisphaera galaxeae]|uniref:choice-of-anchor B family protein n=1 Tax=Aureisphaera galaxeae TaxID=1538023 RepID=UPI002350FF94|nr:choice-of-anchor B family protein [Aureisphaera galaxeae]MDC8002615.1 choice-of-anchor B family protein [Aureisphaera galaxeae]
MKKITTAILLLATGITFAQSPCTGGTADTFPCSGYDLQSRISNGTMGASGANDSWGWTDPQDGKEYAIVGLTNGTAFIDVSDPVNPVYLGKLPTHTDSSIWRDVKVYDNHAFIVSEAGGHGMQVFDLTRLRNVASPPTTFTNDAHDNSFGSAHNIAINEDTGYAYPIGSSLFSGGPIFINIQDPTNPVFEGGYATDGYTHDAQIVTYNGPDTEHAGKEIFIGSNADELVIVDITDKSNPVQLGSTDYPNVGYTHQGWFTEDQRYFLLGDEGDEFDFGFNTRTVVFDLSDLDNPLYDFAYEGDTAAVDHNGYVVGDKFYLSNYAAGLRVLDISDIENGNITLDGYFDTYPSNNSANYSGSWNVYPFFASENIVITGDAGMTLVKASGSLSTEDFEQTKFSLFPNPATDRLTVSSTEEGIARVEIFNVLGQKVLDNTYASRLSETINITSLNTGMYLVTINNTTTKRLVVK